MWTDVRMTRYYSSSQHASDRERYVLMEWQTEARDGAARPCLGRKVECIVTTVCSTTAKSFCVKADQSSTSVLQRGGSTSVLQASPRDARSKAQEFDDASPNTELYSDCLPSILCRIIGSVADTLTARRLRILQTPLDLLLPMAWNEIASSTATTCCDRTRAGSTGCRSMWTGKAVGDLPAWRGNL
ncbi:hypothetical protein PENSPDRAFT_670711 [Peniophora sp. CONT]|nr:hypothetical protein PENSPDRAFT_670711 [Peniophora sp. CONT]